MDSAILEPGSPWTGPPVVDSPEFPIGRFFPRNSGLRCPRNDAAGPGSVVVSPQTTQIQGSSPIPTTAP